MCHLKIIKQFDTKVSNLLITYPIREELDSTIVGPKNGVDLRWEFVFMKDQSFFLPPPPLCIPIL